MILRPLTYFKSTVIVLIRYKMCVDSILVFGYRCNQLPLIEKLPQWLSGPSSPLSVTAGQLDGYRTRFK